jgi:hypothetical protein
MDRPPTVSYAESLAGVSRERPGAAPPASPKSTQSGSAALLPELAGEIDARLCSLHRVADALREVVEGTRQESPIFNISTFETRASAISTMRQLHAELQKLTAIVAKNGAAAEALHRAELKAAQEGLNRAQTQAADGILARLTTMAADRHSEPARPAWAQAAPTPAPAAEPGAKNPAAWAKVASSSGTAVPRPVTPALALVRRSVRVVGDVTVDAVVLPITLKTAPEVFAAITAGDLYYVPHWNHFAVRVGGCVLHAGLGRIYRGAPPRSAGPVAREAPECVKECRRARCAGGAGCRYYHDPEDFPDSTDVRNFMADSWYYTPAVSPARYGTRRIGSASDLEADIRAIGLDEARRFLHQTAHDVLCAAILWQHVVVPAQRQKRADAAKAGGRGRDPPR